MNSEGQVEWNPARSLGSHALRLKTLLKCISVIGVSRSESEYPDLVNSLSGLRFAVPALLGLFASFWNSH